MHSNRATAPEGCSYRSLNVDARLMRLVTGEGTCRDRGLPFFRTPVVLEKESLMRFRRLHLLLEGRFPHFSVTGGWA